MRAVLTALRHAAWGSPKSGHFALIVIVTIAMALGAVTAMFSAVNALDLRRLPVSQPGQLVLISSLDHRTSSVQPIYVSALANLQSRQRSFSHLEAYSGGALLTTEVNGHFTTAQVETASGGYFELLGIRPLAGRLFGRHEEAEPVVVLGYDFWQREFRGAADAIGRTLKVRGVPLTVIGITPERFSGLHVDRGFDVAFPIALLQRMGVPLLRANHLLARLQPSSSLAEATSELETVWPIVQAASVPPQLSQNEQDAIRTSHVRIESVAGGISFLRTRYSRPFQVLSWLAGLLLLIAAVNLSTMFLARGAAREHEIAVRAALGGTSRRIAGDLLVETIILAAIGAILAAPVAWLATRWLIRAMGAPLAFQPTMSLAPDGVVFVTIGGLALVMGIAVGALPALATTRVRSAAVLHHARTVAHPGTRWGRSLLIGQVALSLALFFEAALLGRSVWNLEHVDLGVPRDGILALRLSDQPGAYATLNRGTYYPELVERLSSLPGVQAVALNKMFPWLVTDGNQLENVTAAGAVPAGGAPSVLEVVSPGFFAAARIPLQTGRDFDWQDTEARSRVVIVNASLSRTLFPRGSAVGQTINVGNDAKRQQLTIVGVVADASLGNLRSSGQRIAYRPWMQEPQWGRYPSVIIRASAPRTAIEMVRRTIESLGVEFVLVSKTLEDQIESAISPERIAGVLSVWLAAIAGVLAGLGLYGVVALKVARRSREIGVRLALGASRWIIVGALLRDAVGTVVFGIALGVPLALAASRGTAHLLFGVSADNSVLLGLAGAALLAAALAATLIPARRAARVDAMVAVRE